MIFRRIRWAIGVTVAIWPVAWLVCAIFPPRVFAGPADVPTIAATDFVDFWAAARLLLTGGNPFSPAEVFELQKSVGLAASEPLLMWNPPWTLSLVLPFGAMEYVVSRFCWLLLHVVFILSSAQVLWMTYDRTGGHSYLPWLAAMTLVPGWFVLLLGQLSPLVLLGIVGFLRYVEQRKWILAGIATSLISAKPHLAYLFWIALLFWVVHERRSTLAIAAVVAVSILAIVPAAINPAVYSQFIEMYRNPGQATPFELPAPSLGSFLKLAVPHENVPVQFLPPMAGALWLVWYWTRHKDGWNWPEQLPLILLVSVSTTAYAWSYDYVVLLPAVIHGLVITRSMGVWYKNSALIFYSLINGLYLGLKFVLLSDYYYFWLAPAFLLTYLKARSAAKPRSASAL
jgi:hypothetical protein